MNLSKILLVILFLPLFSCSSLRIVKYSNDLTLIPLSSSVFIHETYLETQSFGTVSCNGMVYINDGEAVVFDTPPNDSVSEQLLRWISDSHPGVKVKAVVIDHFHNDCVGGLKAFHSRGIPSYSYAATPGLLLHGEKPSDTFRDSLVIAVGDERIISYYPGEAHTRDNIVSYIPNEAVLFGGCMVKEIGAGQGNIADANIPEWPKTIGRVKSRFNDIKTVVPGHGKHGGTELLDYTIDLFKQ